MGPDVGRKWQNLPISGRKCQVTGENVAKQARKQAKDVYSRARRPGFPERRGPQAPSYFLPIDQSIP